MLVQFRALVIHYHLFKCAGTSLARALREFFGEHWRYVEGPDNRLLPPDELAEFIVASPGLGAISSHTALLPPPVVEGVRIFPIVFIRHPLDRALSVYEFERRQDASTPGAQMAKQTDLAGYVRWRLDRVESAVDHSLASFQAWRLAPAGQGPTTLEQALSAIDSLPFVGVVERYEESLAHLEELLGELIPGIGFPAYRENVSRIESTLEERMERLLAGLGEDLYRRLEEANLADMQLWRAVMGRYPERASGPAQPAGQQVGAPSEAV